MLERALLTELPALLRKWGKMVFLSGPRQVGKTTLARELLRRLGEGVFVNWDVITDRKRLARDPYFFEHEPRRRGARPLLVFDEIHKYARWKSYLEGVYDAFHDEYRILVTGSGRLDLYRKGGESLLGRYVGIPLFPLSSGELLGRRPRWDEFTRRVTAPAAPPRNAGAVFARLYRFGGFPKPYVRAEPEFYRVWTSTTRESTSTCRTASPIWRCSGNASRATSGESPPRPFSSRRGPKLFVSRAPPSAWAWSGRPRRQRARVSPRGSRCRGEAERLFLG